MIKKNNNTIAKILTFDTSASFSFCLAKCEEGGVHQSPCPPMLSAYLLPKFIWLSVLLDLYIKQETFKYTWIRVYFTWSNLIAHSKPFNCLKISFFTTSILYHWSISQYKASWCLHILITSLLLFNMSNTCYLIASLFHSTAGYYYIMK